MDDPADRFEATAEQYAAHRPGYGEAAVDHLAERFGLDGSARLLDLGCGTGQLTTPLAARAGEVVAMDPSGAMLERARERAAAAGRSNVSFRRGSDADLQEGMGPFRLTAMGRSFHWMDGRATLRTLRRLTEPGGGVAMLTDREWLTKGRADWMAAVHEAASRHADVPERVDPATVEYDDPWDGMLADCGFADVETRTFPVEREWTVDGAVGYVLSLSFCAPDVVDDRSTLAADVRETLRARGGGPFEQSTEVEVISGRREDGDGDGR